MTYRAFHSARILSAKPALGLAYFIEVSKARNLWRFVVRKAYSIPDEARKKEILNWARSEFSRHNGETDATKIKYLVTMGIKEVNGMVRALNL